MNWGDYKKWLLENILERKEGGDKYALLPTTQEKYLVMGGEELEEALNDFLASVDRKHGDITYYSLREWKEGESWEELFPERREILFGVRKKKTPPSEKAWNDLIRLYNYWGTEKEREEKLREQAKELWTEVEQEGKEVVTSLVSETSEKNNFFVRYQNWLRAYELLGKEAQQNLRGHKKLIEKDQNSLHKGNERRAKREQWLTKRIEEIEEVVEMLENQLSLSANQKVGNARTFFISLLTGLIIVAIIAVTVYLTRDKLIPILRNLLR